MWEAIEKLCKERNVSINKLSVGAGIPYTCLHDYKTGRSKPKIDKLKKIADFFGVNVSDLIEQ